jgi:hypothetical protein
MIFGVCRMQRTRPIFSTLLNYQPLFRGPGKQILSSKMIMFSAILYSTFQQSSSGAIDTPTSELVDASDASDAVSMLQRCRLDSSAVLDFV